MKRPELITSEGQALDMIARCSEAATTINELLEATKHLPRAHARIVRVALLIIDIKHAAQAYRNEVGARINQR